MATNATPGVSAFILSSLPTPSLNYEAPVHDAVPVTDARLSQFVYKHEGPVTMESLMNRLLIIEEKVDRKEKRKAEKKIEKEAAEAAKKTKKIAKEAEKAAKKAAKKTGVY